MSAPLLYQIGMYKLSTGGTCHESTQNSEEFPLDDERHNLFSLYKKNISHSKLLKPFEVFKLPKIYSQNVGILTCIYSLKMKSQEM